MSNTQDTTKILDAVRWANAETSVVGHHCDTETQALVVVYYSNGGVKDCAFCFEPAVDLMWFHRLTDNGTEVVDFGGGLI